MILGMKSDARRLSPAAQEALRRRAVAAIEEGHMTQAQAAKTFGVARKTVWLWMKAYRRGGEAALAARKRGPKRPRAKLLGWQAATVCNIIRDRHPEQIKLPFALWTADAVRRLIARRFGVKLSARSVRRYLKRWGFTPQKPARAAYERDPEAVRRWLEEQYPRIHSRARGAGGRIYWADEMGVRSDHQAGRSYAPRGRTPTRPGTGRRFGANLLSALTNRGELAFMIFKGRFCSKVMLRFLRRLVRHCPRKVFLIVDRHPVHRSRAVRSWVEAHSDSIEMFFLPSYSPQLNPDEMVNQDVKANAVGRRRPRTQSQMIRTIRRYLERRRRDVELVKRYFHAQSVRYAAV
jgi:transposase